MMSTYNKDIAFLLSYPALSFLRLILVKKIVDISVIRT